MQDTLNRAIFEEHVLNEMLGDNMVPVFDSEEAKRERDSIVYPKKDYRNTGKSKDVLKRRKRNKNKKTHRN